ncbi:PKD domain-containing protein [Oerskovia sp. M15]
MNTGGCLTSADLAPLAEIEFQRLTITPSPVTVQPPDGWTLVNVDTITYTTPTPQTFATTLLGIPVSIRATPTTYTWDFDDGSEPMVTTDPGSAYPHQSIAHTYRSEGSATISLGTTWEGVPDHRSPDLDPDHRHGQHHHDCADTDRPRSPFPPGHRPHGLTAGHAHGATRTEVAHEGLTDLARRIGTSALPAPVARFAWAPTRVAR